MAAYALSWATGFLISALIGIEDANLSFALGMVVVVSLLLGMTVLWLRTRYRRLRAIKLSDVDYMDGLDFEHYVARLMERQGYRDVRNIRGSGDFGVDVIAEKDGMRYAVQVKRYRGKVSRRAVSDAVAGKYQFNCEAAMVVTNNYYTAGAKELAAAASCVLVDRDTLADWILDFQRG